MTDESKSGFYPTKVLPIGTSLEIAEKRELPVCVKCSKADGKWSLAVECELCSEQLDGTFICDGLDHFHKDCFLQEQLGGEGDD